MRAGWILGLPQSSEIAITPGVFLWNDRDRARRDLHRHLMAIRARFRVDEASIVLGGFSMGARLALELGLAGWMGTSGIVAVASWLPDVEVLTGALRPDVVRTARVYIIVGRTDDTGYSGSLRLVDYLKGAGAASEIEIHEGGHDYPPDMAASLERALAFVAPAVASRGDRLGS